MGKKKFKELDVKTAQTIAASVIELKVDGTGMEWDGSEFLSHRLVERSDRYGHIVDELKKLDAKIAGEVAIAPDSGLQPHVLTLNKRENWDKAKFYLYGIDELKGKDVRGADPVDARKMIDELLKPRFNNLRSCRRFRTFQDGWKYVEARIKKGQYAEGIVLKEGGRLYKVKNLREGKFPIVGLESGSVKGAFIIEMPGGEHGKCSALSVAHVAAYEDMLKAGEVPYAEIEYQFLTDNKIPFQPRLRQIDTLAALEAT